VLIIVVAATLTGWLLLVFLTFTGQRQASARPARDPHVGDEPPAVVSHLAGLLNSAGYQATLLDLAARGWFRLDRSAAGPTMCVLLETPPAEALTPYERQAADHVARRGYGTGAVPAPALADGFEHGTDEFMKAFRSEVAADTLRRGLKREKLTAGQFGLLLATALAPAVTLGFQQRAAGMPAPFVPAFLGFLAACWVLAALCGERITPAGQAALDRWRAECDAYGSIPGLVADEDRLTAYAAALGAAPAAVADFSRTRASECWSGYGGNWRQVVIGDPQPRPWLGSLPVTIYLSLGCSAVLALLLTAVLAGTGNTLPGLLMTVLVIAGVGTILASQARKRYLQVPVSAEFDGQVTERWTELDEDDRVVGYMVAIDDGKRPQAWAFRVSAACYAWLTPGTLVHARVNPRRNELLALRPLNTRVPDPARPPSTNASGPATQP
jgi:hypothetical protein